MRVIVRSLLELPSCNLVEAHTAKVVFVDSGDLIGSFNELETLFTVLFAFGDV